MLNSRRNFKNMNKYFTQIVNEIKLQQPTLNIEVCLTGGEESVIVIHFQNKISFYIYQHYDAQFLVYYDSPQIKFEYAVICVNGKNKKPIKQIATRIIDCYNKIIQLNNIFDTTRDPIHIDINNSN